MQQSINKDPTILESTGLSSTSVMTSNDNLPPHESTSKAKLQLKMSTPQGLHETLFNTKSAKIQPFGTKYPFFKILDDFQPLESTSKGYFKPKISPSKGLNKTFCICQILASCTNDPTSFRYISQFKQN